MKKFALTVIFLIFSAPCFAGYYTFAEWERLSPIERAAYVAGMFDTMQVDQIGNLDPLEGAIPRRYSDCIVRSKMTSFQLSEGLLALSREKPNLRSALVYTAFAQFVTSLCPDLLGQQAIKRLFDDLMPLPPPAPAPPQK